MAEAIDTAVRQAKRARRIPKTARCADCGIADPIVLHPDGRHWRCDECGKVRRGVRPDEAHHILGIDVDSTTVELPANLHRVLSDEQLDIPEEIRQMSPHDPLVWIIRVLCAIRDFGLAILSKLQSAIAWLTRLLLALIHRFGARWPDELGLPPLFG